MGCLYWVFIGWWLEPIKFVFNSANRVISGIAKMVISVFIFLMIVGIVVSIAGAIIPLLILVAVLMVIFNLIIGNYKYKKVNFDSMNGIEFEKFCAETLKRNGFYGVKETKVSGDHGIDILAYKNREKYAIQCKCYSANVGNKAVQEAYSGKTIYDADVAVVITNRYFTKQAILDASALNVQLWDRNDLKRMMHRANRGKANKDNLHNNEDVKNNKQNTVGDNRDKNEKYSDEFIDNYARYCNAHLEHEEEMQQYKEYYNIKDKENGE